MVPQKYCYTVVWTVHQRKTLSFCVKNFVFSPKRCYFCPMNLLNDYYGELGIYFYLIPIISSFWAAFALLALRKRLISQTYLAVVFLLLGLGMIASFWYDRYSLNVGNNILRSVNLIFSATTPLAVLFYFVSLIRPDKLTRPYITRFAVIGLIYSVLILGTEFFEHDADHISGWEEVLNNLSHPTVLFRLMAAVCIVLLDGILFFITLRMYFRHRKFISQTYSYEEDINLDWILESLFLFAIFGIADLMWVIDDSVITKAVFNIVAIVLICRLFWLGFRQEAVPVLTSDECNAHDSSPETTAESCGTLSLSPAQQDKIGKLLDNCLNNSELFLNPNLNLNDVAEALGTNRTYLSQYINGSLNTTFYEMVNQTRISHVLKLLNENPNQTIEQLLESSGFKSRSVFYKYFKQAVGKSPSAYLKELQEESVK